MHALLPFVVRLHSGNYTDTNFNRYSDVTLVEKQIWRPINASAGCPGSEDGIGAAFAVCSAKHTTSGCWASRPALVHWLLPDFHWRHEIISNMFDIYKSRLWRLRIDLEQQNDHFHTKYLRSLWKMNHLWPGLRSGHTPRGWRGGDLGKSSRPVWPAYETS